MAPVIQDEWPRRSWWLDSSDLLLIKSLLVWCTVHHVSINHQVHTYAFFQHSKRPNFW